MSAFLDALTSAILPVFAVPAIAYVLGRRGIFDRAMAEAINRFVFLLAIPAVTFYLMVTADIAAFDWTAVLTYLGIELALYAGSALTLRHLFGLGPRESLLLGMTCGFSNTVIFVLPIAVALYGEAASLPVIAVITVDSVLIFAGTVLVLDVLDNRAGGPLKVLTTLARNPLIVSLGLGTVILVAGVPLHPGLIAFVKFLGGAAPPAALFSLGVIMSAVPLSRFDAAACFAAFVKVAAMPLSVMAALGAAGTTGIWSGTMVLISAGPCGAMAFVVALRYGVATDRIAASIILSTVTSIFTLALLA